MTHRIDTLRNRIDATVKLLETIGTELDDLHVLAYERHAAAREIAVRGGDRDYALDTHGNPKARDAFRSLGDATISACNFLAEASHDAIVVLRDGDADTPRKHRVIEADEFVAALAAQARRHDRGEYTPTRTQPQPEVMGIKHTIDRLRRERDQAVAQVASLTKRLERWEPVSQTRGRRRRRSR